MNAITTTNATTVPAGTFVCEFGNPSDTTGYRKSQVRVLQKEERLLTVYLVEELGEDGTPTGTLGVATGWHDEDTDALTGFNCTSARTIGSFWGDEQWTRESAIENLGFKAEEEKQTPSEIKIGGVYTCQFGNPWDHSGYELGLARVIQEEKGMGIDSFLIEQLDRDQNFTGLMGIASRGSASGKDLSCLAAKKIGKTFMGFKNTRESIIKSMGFTAEETITPKEV